MVWVYKYFNKFEIAAALMLCWILLYIFLNYKSLDNARTWKFLYEIILHLKAKYDIAYVCGGKNTHITMIMKNFNKVQYLLGLFFLVKRCLSFG